jgi:hypothetical protein
MTLVKIDVEKVFNTILHEIIGDALRRNGIPGVMINIIMNAYTTIKQSTSEVHTKNKRGVKR